MANQRRAGTIQLQTNGEVLDAKGTFTYGLGTAKRESIVGADRIHGFKETPMVPFIEGAITDRDSLDVKALMNLTGATVNLKLANGKMIVLSDAFYAGEGSVSTEEGEVAVRWEGSGAEEVTA